MGDAARLTVGRDYCRGCRRESRQTFAGYATGDGHENSARPRAFYRQCESCGMPRLVLQNVNDAEGLCRTVLKAWLDRSGTRASSGATGRPFGDGSLDADDGLSFLEAEVWLLYLKWVPAKSHGSFLAYASALLPRRLATWSREASGEAEPNRPGKGRVYPKAHAASVSVSLDGLTSGGDERGERDSSGAGADRHDRLDAGGRADASLRAFEPDHAETRSLDLLRVLAGRGGEPAGDQRGPRRAVAEGAAKQDG